jgi:hypothetical protein
MGNTGLSHSRFACLLRLGWTYYQVQSPGLGLCYLHGPCTRQESNQRNPSRAGVGDPGTLTLALSQEERGREECPDRQWVYQELVRIKSRSIKMLFGSSFVAKDCGDASPRGGRNEDLEKLYQKRPIWGGTAIRNGRRFPRLARPRWWRRPRNPHPSLSQKERGTGKKDPRPGPFPRGEGGSGVNLK